MIKSFFVLLLTTLLPNLNINGQESQDSSVWNKKVLEIVELTARNHPQVTGGCITMTSSGLYVSLIIMALEISKAKEKDPTRKIYLDKFINDLHKKLDTVQLYADLDLHVFDDYLRAGKLADSTPVLKAQKKESLHQALLKATISPLNSAGLLIRILEIDRSVIPYCRYSVITDVGSSGIQLKAALDGILLFAETNINDLPLNEQAAFKTEVKNYTFKGASLQREILTSVRQRIKQHK